MEYLLKSYYKIPTEVWQMWTLYTHPTPASTLFIFKSTSELTKQRQLSLIIIPQISFGFSFWQVTVYVHLIANPVGCCQQLGRTSRSFHIHWALISPWLSTGTSKALLFPAVNSQMRKKTWCLSSVCSLSIHESNVPYSFFEDFC